MDEKLRAHVLKRDSINTFMHYNFNEQAELEQDYAVCKLDIRPESLNPFGMVHGGAMATLADTVGGCCACSKGGNCVTAGSSMEFLRPAHGAKIYCEATPKKLGRTLSVVQVVLSNDDGAEVATGTFTFFMTGDEK